jgi:lantibiotic modifying enzyme
MTLLKWFKEGLAISVVAPLILSCGVIAADRPYLKAALDAARWIESSAIKTDHGVVWPADPRDPKTVDTSLYAGTPGVVLFFLEAYRTTGDANYLKMACAGADSLLAALPVEKGTGLYEGAAGIGFVLEETYKTSKDPKYRQGALQCLKAIQNKGIRTGKGIQWSDTTDIISGNAGTALFLLYAAREMREASFRELAVQAGKRLIEVGRADAGGLKWAMDPKYPRLMPNFSHGTAGIAYFLATLYGETNDREFLDAALAGAEYLQAVAKTEGDTCLIFHNEPDGKDLYYLGYCHGPVGTARLWYRLYQTTRNPVWLDWLNKSAQGILQSGIPEKQTPGFWNNVGVCCGSAGVAEFFLDVYLVTKDRRYLNFSRRVTDNLLVRGSHEGQGMKWIQAEHRVRPDFLVAQTGLMQGAAGIGMWLLRLDGFDNGKEVKLRLPDSPF